MIVSKVSCRPAAVDRKAAQRISVNTGRMGGIMTGGSGRGVPLTSVLHSVRLTEYDRPNSNALCEGARHPRAAREVAADVRPRAGDRVGRGAEAGNGLRHARTHGREGLHHLARRGGVAGPGRVASPAV